MINIIIINIIITLFIVFYLTPKCKNCEHFDATTLIAMNAAKEIGKSIFLTDGKIVIPKDIIIDGSLQVKSLKINNKSLKI